MSFATFNLGGETPLIATAIHNGHEIRPDLDSYLSLDEATRLREEDSHTDLFARVFENHVVVHRSRFEVDLNRPKEEAVYTTPDDAWGLELWNRPLKSGVIRESIRLHDEFYDDLSINLDKLVSRHGGFVLYDIHSYNHRRHGPAAPPEPISDNPAVNLGTGSLPARWRPVAETFLEQMRSWTSSGDPIDARENIKFQGRHMAAWVHENYGESACALAIEFKKEFMNEWTDLVYADRQQQLSAALQASTGPVLDAWRRACR